MIKIGDKEYKIKVVLGFYKRLSFSKSELNTIHDNANRLFEALKLALFFGNKEERGWHSLADMEKEISDEMIEDIDDGNIIDKLSQAVYDNHSDAMKALIDKVSSEREEDLKKK